LLLGTLISNAELYKSTSEQASKSVCSEALTFWSVFLRNLSQKADSYAVSSCRGANPSLLPDSTCNYGLLRGRISELLQLSR